MLFVTIEDASSSAAQTGGLKFFIREDGNFKESFRLTREGNVNIAEAGDSNTAKLDVTHSGNNGGAGVPTYVCRFFQNTNLYQDVFFFFQPKFLLSYQKLNL